MSEKSINQGVVLDVRVGEELRFDVDVSLGDVPCIRVLVEKKEGQRARLRVIADRRIIVSRPQPNSR